MSPRGAFAIVLLGVLACSTDPARTPVEPTGDSGTAGAGGADADADPCPNPDGPQTLCGSACVDVGNDIQNCGHCGNVCGGAHPFCGDGGVCGAPPCEDAGSACVADAGAGAFCCGNRCCAENELCCLVYSGGPEAHWECDSAEMGTCQPSCAGCT